ncbi:sensor histidine kinase [Croceicoccus bisphenolivorans]|uniref:sensor histidine kinase n=1 Tax=Croceicoccus bisphenolivorans TaxID=1783232 RepID=UPI00155FC92E|nr:histidine kinase [Croceicoccus bisphenolivorans]
MIRHNLALLASRMICAVALVAIALTDPAMPGFQLEFDDVFALCYLVWVTATTIASLRSWFVDFVFSAPLIIADIVAFTVLLIFLPVHDDAMIASTLSFLAHIVFTSVLRWRSRLAYALAASVYVNLFWMLEVILIDFHAQPGGSAHALRMGLFAIVGSIVIFCASRQISRSVPVRFRAEDPEAGLPLPVSAFDYISNTTGARRIVFCWKDRYDSRKFAFDSRQLDGDLRKLDDRAGKGDHTPVELDFTQVLAFRELAPMLFDLARERALIQRGGMISIQERGPIPGAKLLKDLGVVRGICMPIITVEGTDWLILSDIPLLGWSHLRSADAICTELAQEVDVQISALNAREAALAGLRQAIARDLHDSVAHSLAGAKYLLLALRTRVADSPGAVEEIDAIRDALEAEHRNVRQLITQLRDSEPDTGLRNFIEDVTAIIPNLALRWHLSVELVDSDYRLMVPAWLSLELQQLVREAVSNAARHGKASALTVQCRRKATRIEITVIDNGKGFAADEVARPRSISERIALLGGELEMQCRPGATILLMSFTLQE